MNDEKKYNDNTGKFITYLLAIKRREDRGTLANLRKGLRNSAKLTVMPYLIEYSEEDDWKFECFRIVAGIFANDKTGLPSQEKGGESEKTGKIDYGNFGQDLAQFHRKIYGQQKPKDKEVDSFTKRFMHLLAADEEEIFDRVLRLALRVQKDNISINYHSLIKDLMKFKFEPQEVKKKWSKSYFNGIH